MNDRKIPYYQDYCEHYLTIIIRYPPNEWKHCNRIANRALLWFNTEITEDDQIFLKALFAKDIKSIPKAIHDFGGDIVKHFSRLNFLERNLIAYLES